MGETVSPGPFRLARFLALVLVASVDVRAQLNSCGQHQCHTFAMGGDQYPCWDAPDLDAWGPKFVHEWTNCSAAWGSDFRGVNRSRWWDGASKTVSDWDYCTLNYFAYRFVCLEADGKTETKTKCKTDADCPGATICYAHGPYAQWLTSNPTFATNEQCHNIIRKWNCASQVPPFDVAGHANTYALRTNSVWGSSACRSVCEALWDACGLWDRDNASQYVGLHGMDCHTPFNQDDLKSQRYGTSSADAQPDTGACWHLNGSVTLPKCSWMPPCQNGGVYGPSCEGCLCRPGFGGIDCSRCSPEEEMWPVVFRDPRDYGSGTWDGDTYASAACAHIHGDSDDGPVGNGTMVNKSLHTCTVLTHIRPIPSYVGKGGSTGGNVTSNATHAAASRINSKANVSTAILHYDCAYRSDGLFDIYLNGGVFHLEYGIHADPSCFSEALGGWDSSDCSLDGNMTFRIIKQLAFFDTLHHYKKDIKGYNPVEMECDVSECVKGETADCLKNGHLPKDYVEPCVKCEHIKCTCPSNSFFANTVNPLLSVGECFLSVYAADLTKGIDSKTYLACSESTGECTIFNSDILIEIDLPYCRSSTCANVPARKQSTSPETDLVVFLVCLGVLQFWCLSAAFCACKPTCYEDLRCACRHNGKAGWAWQPSKKRMPLLSVNSGSHLPSGHGRPKMKQHVLLATNVFYSIPNSRSNTNKSELTIVKDFNLVAKTAHDGVMAIMGPSGAGKTTFLDVLAGKVPRSGALSGSVQLDAQTISPRARRRLFGYVQQQEALIDILSVTETLNFAFDMMTRPSTSCSSRCRCTSSKLRQATISRILSQLALTHVQHKMIGSPAVRGLSGGERRRVAVGIQMVRDPQVLLLDEPTTGLDAANAKAVMQVLTNLVVQHRRIVVCTVHQPRSEIYTALGGITIVGPGGRMLFSGKAGPEVLRRFENVNSRLKYTLDVNPADYILDVVATCAHAELDAMADEEKKRFFINIERPSGPGKQGESDSDSSDGIIYDVRKGVTMASIMACPCQFFHLSQRAAKQTFRSPTLLMLQYVMPILIGVAFGFVYAGITPDISGIQNYAGSFFALQVFWCLASMTALELWNSDRVCVFREIDSSAYSVFPYYLAYALNDLVTLRMLPPVFFAVPFALLSGIGANDVQLFGEFCTVLVLTSCAFASICSFLGTIISSSRTSSAVGVLTMMFSLIFGGLLVNHASALTGHKWYQPLFFATPLFYAYEALLVLVLQGVNIEFNPKGFDISQKTDGGIWLANFGMHTDNKYRDMVALAAFAGSFFCLAGISLIVSKFVRSSEMTCSPRRLIPSESWNSRLKGLRLIGEENVTDSNRKSDSYSPEEGMKVTIDSPLNILDEQACQENLSPQLDDLEAKDDTEHHSLRFHNVCVKIGRRQILRAVSATVSTRDDGVFAIIGPSGAGKTSLLDVISGRKNVGRFSGDIFVDGIMFASVRQRQQVFGYVMQEETLVDVLTVREALAFSASLRGTCARKDMAVSVEAVMAELGLKHVADSRIGSVETFRGISGGEKKRVSIGMELMAGPPVMLLDEPTTGLDAAAAASVMKTLTNLVKRRGTLVICTIHQPRAEIFRSFGTVLLLRPLSASTSAHSNVVLCSPPQDCRNMLLRSSAAKSISDPGANIADVLLDLVAAGDSFEEYGIGGSVSDVGNVDSDRIPRIRRTSFEVLEPETNSEAGDVEKESITFLCCESMVQRVMACFGEGKSAVMACVCCTSPHAMTPWELRRGSRGRGDETPPMNVCCYRACGCWWTFGVLLRLEAIRTARRPASMLVHAFVGIFMGIFIGFLYANLQPNTDGVWNRLMGLFSITSLFALLGLSAIGTWQDDRLRFLRERAAGYYGTIPYYVSKWIVDAVTLRIFPVCMFVACSYTLIGWSTRFETAFVNSDTFYNASGCTGPIGNSGACGKDPLAIDGNDFGAWGRSWWLQIMSLSLAALSSANFASLVTAFTANARVANFATVLIILFCLMFSGALVSISSMNWALKLVSSMSPFAFTLEAINIGTFQNQCFLFNPTTIESLFSGSKKALACTEVPGYKWLLQFGCTHAGNRSTGRFGSNSCQYDYGTIERDLLQASILLVGLAAAAVLALMACVRERR